MKTKKTTEQDDAETGVSAGVGTPGSHYISYGNYKDRIAGYLYDAKTGKTIYSKTCKLGDGEPREVVAVCTPHFRVVCHAVAGHYNNEAIYVYAAAGDGPLEFMFKIEGNKYSGFAGASFKEKLVEFSYVANNASAQYKNSTILGSTAPPFIPGFDEEETEKVELIKGHHMVKGMAKEEEPDEKESKKNSNGTNYITFATTA